MWKFGVQYQINDKWQIRAGYNRSDNPIGPADVTFNILAPGVVKDQYSIGVTYRDSKEHEFTFAGMYAAGWGVTPSYQMALEWFRKAAAQKNAVATYNVGRFYDNGWGVAKDPGEALRWYRTAAELGDGEAQGRLAFLLATAPEPSYEEAARWFERTRAACGPPGLLAEEFDVAQRQLRGNLPQAFVHALLLECAARQYEL